jgi:hypothetical protein
MSSIEGPNSRPILMGMVYTEKFLFFSGQGGGRFPPCNSGMVYTEKFLFFSGQGGGRPFMENI